MPVGTSTLGGKWERRNLGARRAPRRRRKTIKHWGILWKSPPEFIAGYFLMEGRLFLTFKIFLFFPPFGFPIFNWCVSLYNYLFLDRIDVYVFGSFIFLSCKNIHVVVVVVAVVISRLLDSGGDKGVCVWSAYALRLLVWMKYHTWSRCNLYLASASRAITDNHGRAGFESRVSNEPLSVLSYVHFPFTSAALGSAVTNLNAVSCQKKKIDIPH